MTDIQEKRLPDSFSRVFAKRQLTVGLLTPVEAYPNNPFPSLKDHGSLVLRAEEAGFASIWLRDVPFYDPTFGDAAQIVDPFVYAGYLASITRQITLGSAGIVLPLRDPISVAKQSASVDLLTAGRFILGVSTGDRPAEYPAFGIDFAERAERFRESIAMIKRLQQEHFPDLQSRYYGTLSGALDLHPKPKIGSLPMVAVGRASQSFDWLAQHMDAWIWSVDEDTAITGILGSLAEAAGDRVPPRYGYATFFDLDANPDAPYQRFYNVVRIGRKALIERLLRHKALGVSHVALNLKSSRREARAVIDEMGEHVLPALTRA
ncbi:TIGR03571 family LLM class oxidoreductase [Aeromonas media]|uniref:TIGR03571 family LLM class oxidoreductase n=1 Tax=Aeromonas media TaxID=651 RepID=UPI00111ADA02|nr:TIGR03571 family LLM class oxidoreductase [Aeromonas media]TNI66993.1 LLM class flavin-dependent oxidoreductase [Aeromonas media]